MIALSEKIAKALRVDSVLSHSERYLAHLPRKGGEEGQPPETLGEHMALVLKCAEKICQKHELDAVAARLIESVVQSLGFVHAEIARDYISELFVDTIAFHDFGKTNEFFQIDKMKNPDKLFQHRIPEIFSPRSGHSELGAFIFSVFHLERINTLDIPEEDETDKVKLSAVALLFSNSILLHHSPKLVMPKERVLRSQFLEKRIQLAKYIKLYRDFPVPDISNFYFDSLREVFSEIEETPTGFSFFALLRLNFSLLTAADYLATGEYSYGLNIESDEDWGIFSGMKRTSFIEATRSNPDPGKQYNRDAYDLFDKVKKGQYSTKKPELELREPTNEHLNLLRTEMAVKVLETLELHSDKRLFFLEAPTGGGKTNLSMLAVSELFRADERLTKVFYVFPFTTLITQTHQAIKETLLLQDEQIALLHSRAGFQTNNVNGSNEEESDGVYGNQRKDFLQNLFALYPVSLVTHVRFFDILKSNRKDDIYLMHRLANSVVVLDELQSYPPRQWDKILFMLEQYGKFFNIRFILMSATLPRLTEIEAVQRAAGMLPEVVDLLPGAKAYFQNPNFQGRVKFKFDLLDKGDLTADELAVEVLAKSRLRSESHEGRVFTIVEFIFKKSATEFRNVLDQFEPFFDEIFVLSGTILESRRREIINYLKRQRKAKGIKVLLITTQVVEAGVDIDMDLGFKNISLIDSDEQLAGRVNRNVGKLDCEVWLFRKDNPMTLYKSDLRYQITKELPPDFHREILETKDFLKLYRHVFNEIEKRNQSELIENFETDYVRFIQKLDFPKVDEKLPIIDQQTLSVFVPVELPIEIQDMNGVSEPFFSDFEMTFLTKAKSYNVFSETEKTINGAGVWNLYLDVLSNPNADFIAKKIEQKVMQGILAKFTFSMFASPKNRAKLSTHSHLEQSFDNYFYLHRWQEDGIYTIESGLDESRMDDPIL